MNQDYISYNEAGRFSSLICDYLEKKPQLNTFYNNFFEIDYFEKQIEQKKASYNRVSRAALVSVLKTQYEKVDASALTVKHIESLALDNTFTITTGHQLNLFSGPLYFLYKIVSAINLSKQLKAKYPNNNFVPIYWMATEDHDFDEINYFNFKGKKFQWHKTAAGAVGDLDTEGLDTVLELFKKEIGTSTNALELIKFFEDAYIKHKNLTDATRFLANALFKAYGLVIVDANNAQLKRLFVPYIKKELTEQVAFKTVTKTNKELTGVSNNYNIQVNPREINLFYIDKNIRERIIYEADYYKVLNTAIRWTKTELLRLVEEKPERFSPNVIMRPLYQEVILPNLCYIGGGGEIAYWLQLKSYFEKVEMVFPILLLRNSVLIRTEKQARKLKKLNIKNEDLFLKRDALINKKVREISNIDIDFSKQKEHLKQQFANLFTLAQQTDKSFVGAVKSQEHKQLKGLEKLEKRLLKAQKKMLYDEVTRITEIQHALFPNGTLQERCMNFSEIYLEFGDTLVSTLIKNLEPLRKSFLILSL